MSKTKAKKIVEKYVKKLQAENYPYSAVYLFGSYAGNQARKWSEIDVAVISDKLKRNWNKNEETLWKYAGRIDSRIEPIGFTVKDFKDNCDPMVNEVKRTGIKVA